jgi:hypothetical protein
VLDATALNNNPLNSRTLITTLKIKRGRILADNGETLARSVRQAKTGYWLRTYPEGPLFAQPVGYANLIGRQEAGLEKYRLGDLKGPQTTSTPSSGRWAAPTTWATTSTPGSIPRPSGSPARSWPDVRARWSRWIPGRARC